MNVPLLVATQSSVNQSNNYSSMISKQQRYSLSSTSSNSSASSSSASSPPTPNDTFISYRRVRPEPINEKTLVGSFVGFFQDVVGGDSSKQTGTTSSSNASSNSTNSSSLNSTNKSNSNASTSNSSANSSNSTTTTTVVSEIKEQIEWLHFEYINLLDPASSASANKNSPFFNSNILIVIGYKTGFSVWTIDINGVATEALSIREPNIKHAKLLQLETTGSNKLLMATCKLIIKTNDDIQEGSGSSGSSVHNFQSSFNSALSSNSSSTQIIKKYQINIINLINGLTLNEIVYNGDVLDLKSNANILCVNSWNRIDAFDITGTFEHLFSINTCYSQISKSTGQIINPMALGNRWLAFADNKFYGIFSSLGGVRTDIEQSYTATVLNTAKSISKGLVKISETVVNSVVSKSKTSSLSNGSSSGSNSPRLNSNGKTRHDSKEEYQPGICTIVDTRKYINTPRKPADLHDENQNWIVAHFLAHQEAVYAIEFNHNGRLLVTADCLGQYFNVFQINANAFKCTRTVVKHLYSLYRGDTTAKVRNITFSSDSRWLAIGTKRGTTHIFPLNSYGGPVNARTHSKPYIVNRTAKHQRTAGFIDQDDTTSSSSQSKIPLINNSNLLNTNNHHHLNDLQLQQQYNMQQMLQQQYDNSCSSPIVVNNNPKLKSLLEPFVIPAYGQLKQPNTNSTFQSSVISSNGASASNNSSTSGQSTASNVSSGLNLLASSLTGSNIAASAFSSAALVTENVTTLASNTTNMIQYDNVCSVAVFGESRGYLSPEEPRDFTLNKLKPANSLFVISDVNGNLVEYVLDVLVDTSKNNKPTNDSPIQLKITPKAQWPLQRFISSEEIRYPIQITDNPLLNSANSYLFTRNSNNNGSFRKHSNLNTFNGADSTPISINTNYSLINQNQHSPNSIIQNQSPTNSLFQTAPNSLAHQPHHHQNSDWIKMIEVNTHMGPHRRLFMGPQFVFKTFNSNLTTTMVNATSSSVMSDVETPIIDLSGDIELNSLDLTSNYSNPTSNKLNNYGISSPMQINQSLSSNQSLYHKSFKNQQRFDCTPTFIEVGSAGSFQEGMPILCAYMNNKNNNNQTYNHSISNTNGDLLSDDNLIETLADAMNELSTSVNTTPTNTNKKPSSSYKPQPAVSPAIAISNTKQIYLNQTSNSSASYGSSGSAFTVGSYFLINPELQSNSFQQQQQHQQQYQQAPQLKSDKNTINANNLSLTSSSSLEDQEQDKISNKLYQLDNNDDINLLQ